MTEFRESLVVRGIGQLALTREPLPEVGRSDAIVRVAFGGICGSDLHYWKSGTSGSSILRESMILGHEVVGTIIKAASDQSGPSAGARVAIFPANSCGNCAQCLAGRLNLCVNVEYLGSAARMPHTDGGFSSQVVVASKNLRPLPASIPLDRFAMTEPASVAWHAVNRATSVSGNRVLVIGAGPIGLAVVAVLQMFDPAMITVVDLHERPLEIALRLGADLVIPSGDAFHVDPQKIDLTFECSGSTVGLEQAVLSTRGGGEIVMVGNQNTGLVPFAAAKTIASELTVKGSFRFDDEFDQVIEAISTGRLDLTPIVTATFAVSDFEKAFALAADAAQSSKVLLTFPSGT